MLLPLKYGLFKKLEVSLHSHALPKMEKKTLTHPRTVKPPIDATLFLLALFGKKVSPLLPFRSLWLCFLNYHFLLLDKTAKPSFLDKLELQDLGHFVTGLSFCLLRCNLKFSLFVTMLWLVMNVAIHMHYLRKDIKHTYDTQQ